jgi:hypothetical protein
VASALISGEFLSFRFRSLRAMSATPGDSFAQPNPVRISGIRVNQR